jgi:hypothetical protein
MQPHAKRRCGDASVRMMRHFVGLASEVRNDDTLSVTSEPAVAGEHVQPWKPGDLKRSRSFDAFHHIVKMEAPLVRGYVVNTLLATSQSVLWAIEDYADASISTSAFESLDMLHDGKIQMYGRECTLQRSVRFLSAADLSTDSSQLQAAEIDRPPRRGRNDVYHRQESSEMSKGDEKEPKSLIESLRAKLADDLQFPFNGVLLNRYSHGQYIGAHSDKEVYPGDKVAAISFGATRMFRIRSRITGKIVLDVPHKAGTLLVMDGNFQNEFTHEVPVQKRVKATRVSLTFRHHHKFKSWEESKGMYPLPVDNAPTKKVFENT